MSSSSDQGFGPEKRLREKDDIARCSNKGRRLHAANFTLHVLSGVNPHSRLAVAVSRKVSTRAVKRNIIKRRLKEFFRAMAR